MRKHAFEDGDVVKLNSGAVGIYSGDDWLGLAAPEGKVWVVIDGDVAAIDPAEISKFGGRSAMRTEAEIVRDLNQAEGLQEQRELVRELETFRRARTAAVQADRDIDIANAFIRDTLTPVLPYQHHTAATDWIEEEATSGPYDHQMRVEATMWFGRVSDEVKEDRDEFSEQAMGMARRVSGQFGLQAEAAFHAFLETVARLHRQGGPPIQQVETVENQLSNMSHERGCPWVENTDASPEDCTCPKPADWMGKDKEGRLHRQGLGEVTDWSDAGNECPSCGEIRQKEPCEHCGHVDTDKMAQEGRRHTADDKPGEVDEDQSGNAESAVTDYDTKDDQEPFLGEDWEDPEHAGVHPEMPGAGEGARENEPRPEKTEARRRRALHVGDPWHESYCGALVNEPCDCGLYEEYPELAPEVMPLEASLQKQADVACSTCGHDFQDHTPVTGFERFQRAPYGQVGACTVCDCAQFTSEDTIEAGASLRKQARPLYEIADEIRRDWTNVYFGAVPYLDALSSMDSINDPYGYDSGDSIVAYFLSNATTWRGEKAREIKAELNKMLKGGSRTAAEGQTCDVCGDSIEKDPAHEDPQTWHHNNGEKHDHEAKPGGGDSSKESSRTAAADGETSFCRLCGQKLQSMEYAWYGLKAFPPQRDVGKHYCVAARLEGRSGEFGPDGVLVPGTPGGGGGQYDSPLGTIYDAGGNAIPITGSRRTAGESFGLVNGKGEFLVDTETGGIRVTKSEANAGRFNRPTADSLIASVQSQMGGQWEIVSLGRRRTAGVYCNTHQVWVGDGNADTHEGCSKEQKATEKTKDARRTATDQVPGASAAEILSLKKQRGVAGSYAWTAQVQYEGEDPMVVSFYGSTYGPPIVMEMDGNPKSQVFVSDPTRFGENLDEQWVRNFFKSASKVGWKASGPGKGRGGQAAPIRGGRKTATFRAMIRANGRSNFWEAFTSDDYDDLVSQIEGAHQQGKTEWRIESLSPSGRWVSDGMSYIPFSSSNPPKAQGSRRKTAQADYTIDCPLCGGSNSFNDADMLEGMAVCQTPDCGHVFEADDVAHYDEISGLFGMGGRKTAGVSLTNIRFDEGYTISDSYDEGAVMVGKDSSGNEVRFRVTTEDARKIRDVMLSDLAINFSGVTVDEGDIV